jgi:uncharacterized membrane protein YkvA (DUF1232 family)
MAEGPVKKRVVKKTATKKAAPNKRTATKKPDINQSYAEARKAVGKLWDDVAKDTHSRFATVSKKVEKRFKDIKKDVSDVDVQYAIDKAEDASKKLLKSATGWVKKLGLQVKLLWEILKDIWYGKFKAPWGTVAAITAALLYIIMPFDILPDFLPAIGFADDLLVITLCVSMIRIDLRRYAKFRNLDLADYEL